MLGLVDRPADGVARGTLNRHERRNALSLDLREELAQVLEAQAADESVRCVVLTGAGSAFCAGMDVTQFGGDRANKERIVATSTRLFELVARYPLPLVAAVNGPAVAGGFALALLCDVRIAAPAAPLGPRRSAAPRPGASSRRATARPSPRCPSRSHAGCASPASCSTPSARSRWAWSARSARTPSRSRRRSPPRRATSRARSSGASC